MNKNAAVGAALWKLLGRTPQMASAAKRVGLLRPTLLGAGGGSAIGALSGAMSDADEESMWRRMAHGAIIGGGAGLGGALGQRGMLAKMLAKAPATNVASKALRAAQSGGAQTFGAATGMLAGGLGGGGAIVANRLAQDVLSQAQARSQEEKEAAVNPMEVMSQQTREMSKLVPGTPERAALYKALLYLGGGTGLAYAIGRLMSSRKIPGSKKVDLDRLQGLPYSPGRDVTVKASADESSALHGNIGGVPLLLPGLALMLPLAWAAGKRSAREARAVALKLKLEEVKRDFASALRAERAAKSAAVIDGLALMHVKRAVDWDYLKSLGLGGYLAAALLLGTGGYYTGKAVMEKMDPRRKEMEAVEQAVRKRMATSKIPIYVE